VLRRTLIFAISLAVIPQLFAQTSIPDWCRPLPRPEYKSIERVPVSDPWFEVYKPAPNVFAIYEPHQAEEVISYLIVGEKRAHRWCERQNIGGSSDVGILTLGQMQDDRPAERIAQRMDFCRTTAPRPADGLIVLPPFPPEAHR